MFGLWLVLEEEPEYIITMDASGHVALIKEDLFFKELNFTKFTYTKPPSDIDYLTIDKCGYNTRYINGIYDLIKPNHYCIETLKILEAKEKDKKIIEEITETEFLFLKKYDNCAVIAPRVAEDNFEYYKTDELNKYFREAAAEMLVL